MTAMPVSWVRYKGDSDSIAIQLSGLALLLPGAVITADLSGEDSTVVGLPGSVLNADDKIVTVPLQSWLSNRTEGRYDLKLHIDGKTWPEDQLAWIDVRVHPAAF